MLVHLIHMIMMHLFSAVLTNCINVALQVFIIYDVMQYHVVLHYIIVRVYLVQESNNSLNDTRDHTLIRHFAASGR